MTVVTILGVWLVLSLIIGVLLLEFRDFVRKTRQEKQKRKVLKKIIAELDKGSLYDAVDYLKKIKVIEESVLGDSPSLWRLVDLVSKEDMGILVRTMIHAYEYDDRFIASVARGLIDLYTDSAVDIIINVVEERHHVDAEKLGEAIRAAYSEQQENEKMTEKQDLLEKGLELLTPEVW